MSVSGRHNGLPQGQTKWDLLRVLQEIGRKELGLTPSAFSLLIFLIRRSRETDFDRGAICASWLRVELIARELDLTERTVNNAQRELQASCLIRVTTSGNGARHGERIGGQIKFASGLCLKPTIERFSEFSRLRCKKTHVSAEIAATRAEIRRIRYQVISSGDEKIIAAMEEMLPGGRVSRIKALSSLKDICNQLANLLQHLSAREPKISDQSEIFGSPNLPAKRVNLYRPAKPADLFRTELAEVCRVATDEFRSLLPQQGISWSSLTDAAAAVCRRLDINQTIWGSACEKLGRQSAATAIVVIEHNSRLPSSHPLHASNPALCLIGLVEKELSQPGTVRKLFKATQRRVGVHLRPPSSFPERRSAGSLGSIVKNLSLPIELSGGASLRGW